MKYLLTAATVIVLAGCAGTQRYDTSSPKYKQCAYQAKMATPDSRSVIADVFRERELIEMCMNQG